MADPSKRALAFRDTVGLLAWRIDLMLALRPEALERLVLEQRLKQIAIDTDPTHGLPRRFDADGVPPGPRRA